MTVNRTAKEVHQAVSCWIEFMEKVFGRLLGPSGRRHFEVKFDVVVVEGMSVKRVNKSV
jgi:hypothetical protein